MASRDMFTPASWKSLVEYQSLEAKELIAEMIHFSRIQTKFNNDVARMLLLDRLDTLRLTEYDLQTLTGSSWLNDQVIHGFIYYCLLQSGIDLTRVICFPSFLYSTLATRGYEGVKRWTRSGVDPALWDIFSAVFLIFPINLDNNHWMLALVDLKLGRTLIFDSLAKSKHELKQVFQFLHIFLNEEHKLCKRRPLPDYWTQGITNLNGKQPDGCSCGVYVCRYAELIVDVINTNGALTQSAVENCFAGESIKDMRVRISCTLSAHIQDQNHRLMLVRHIERNLVFVLASPYEIRRIGLNSLFHLHLPFEVVRQLATFLFTAIDDNSASDEDGVDDVVEVVERGEDDDSAGTDA